MLAQPPGDARLVQIVRRHLHFYAIAHGEPNPALAHLAANRSQHQVLVVQFHSEHGSRENHRYYAFHFDMVFFQLLSLSENLKTTWEQIASSPGRKWTR